MEIILAKSIGFCSGVRRAVDTAMSMGGKGVFVLGELIHNETVTAKLKEKGSVIVNSIDEITGGKVIIRSHGEGKKVFQTLKDRGIGIIDCTCPFVARTQRIVEEYYKQGFQIVVAGEKNHPEVKGLDGWCENTAFVTDG